MTTAQDGGRLSALRTGIWKSSHNKIILNELQVLTQPYLVILYMNVECTYFYMESVKHEKPDLNVCLPFVKCQPTVKNRY